MAGEVIEGTASESRVVVVAEMTAGSGGAGSGDAGHGGVAILLTLAAVVAASIGFMAAMTSSSANSSWQSALRSEVKRSAAAMEDVRYVYGAELPLAVRIIQARTIQAEMLAAAQGQSGPTKAALLLEANVQGQIVTALDSTPGLATNTDYALSSGGLDLGKALAAERAQNPQLVSLDPDGLEAAGDKLAHKALLLTAALIPTSGAAFLAVLAQPFKRRRTLLLRIGGVALAGGAVMGLAVQVLV